MVRCLPKAPRRKCARTNKYKTSISGRRATMLEITDLHSNYGEATVLRGVNLHVPARQITGLLGRNGMGKTTLIRSIMGLTPPQVTQGSVRLSDKELLGMPPEE